MIYSFFKIITISRTKYNQITLRHCNFQSILTKYHFLRYYNADDTLTNPNENWLTQLLSILERNQVPEESRRMIQKELLSSAKTAHSTVGQEDRFRVQREFEGSADLKKKLIQMFYFDYILFGFELPE